MKIEVKNTPQLAAMPPRGARESGWRSFDPGFVRGLRLVGISVTQLLFLRTLGFSSLHKNQLSRQNRVVERITSLWFRRLVTTPNDLNIYFRKRNGPQCKVIEN